MVALSDAYGFQFLVLCMENQRNSRTVRLLAGGKRHFTHFNTRAPFPASQLVQI